MREDAHAQRVQEPFRGATRVARVGPRKEEVGGRRDEEQRRRDEQHAFRALLHAAVQPALDEQRPGERDERVEDDEPEPDQQRLAVRAQEAAEPEGLVRLRLGRDVDLGIVVGRRQRLDRGDELGRDLQRGRARCTHTAAAAPSSAHSHAQLRCDRDERPGPVAVPVHLVAAPQVGRDLGGDRRELVGVVGFGVLARPGEQRAVPLRGGHELLVRAVLHRAAALHHDDAVGETERGATVRDEDRGAVLHDLAQGGVDLFLGPRVDRRRRVVEHEDARVGEHRARDGDALALAARQREPAFAHERVVAVGERVDERRSPGDRRRTAHVVVGGVGPAVRDVVAHAVGEEERVLEHHSDLAPQGIERDVAHVDAVDLDRPLLAVVEAREEEADRRLAGTGGADECDGLTGRDPQREVGQHRLRPEVPVGDVLDDDLPVGDMERFRVGFLGDNRVGVEDLEDAVGRGARLLRDRDDVGHHPHRREQLREVGGEGEERAERDLALDREVPAEREHADLSVGRDRRQHRRVLRLDADVADLRPVQVLGRPAERGDLAVFLAEPLHHADAADGLVDDARDFAGALQRVPLRGVHLAPQLQRDDEQRRNREQADEREERRHQQHEEHRQYEQHDVAGEHRHEREELLHELQVGARARDELTGGELVVTREVEALQTLEQRVAQVVLHVDPVTPAGEAPDVLEPEVHRRHADEERDQRRGGTRVGRDGVVDDRALHEREQRRDHLTRDRDAERDQDVPLVPFEERPELADPARFRAGAHRVAGTGSSSGETVERSCAASAPASWSRASSMTAGSRTPASSSSRRARIERSAARSAARPAGVIVRRTARRSPLTDVRSTNPFATRVSTAADTVGRASASWPASPLARSSPRTISASRRYWGSDRSVHARSNARTTQTRVRISRSRVSGASCTPKD